MATIRRGDVVLVLFPNSDLRSAKRRPALVIQADNLQTGLSQSIVAMITSNMSRASHPSRVTIILDSPEGKQSGLLTNSVVTTDNIVTVRNTAFDRKIGSISMDKVDSALEHTLGLE